MENAKRVIFQHGFSLVFSARGHEKLTVLHAWNVGGMKLKNHMLGNRTGICGQKLSKGKPFSLVASQSKPNKIAGREMP